MPHVTTSRRARRGALAAALGAALALGISAPPAFAQEGETPQPGEVQKKILDLNKERAAYIAEKRKELADDNSLGNAVADAVRKQAETKGVTFETSN